MKTYNERIAELNKELDKTLEDMQPFMARHPECATKGYEKEEITAKYFESKMSGINAKIEQLNELRAEAIRRSQRTKKLEVFLKLKDVKMWKVRRML